MSKLWEMVKDREVWCAAVHGITESDKTDLLNKIHARACALPISRIFIGGTVAEAEAPILWPLDTKN